MHDDGTDSRIKIFANIFISFIGAGILGLPYAFKESGIVEGTMIMSLVGGVSIKAMFLLIDCKNRMATKATLTLATKLPNGSASPLHQKSIDYGDVGLAALGPFGRWLVDINILISQVGFCCAYLIFISENLHSIYPRIPQLAYLFSLLLPLVFLCNLRHLKHLAPFSLFADFATIFAYGIVFYFDMEHFHLLDYHVRNYSLEGLPFYLGVAIYCYEGAGLILSLEGSVTKELRGSFKTIFLVAMVLVTSLYIGFGVCGYLSFGPDTESIITLNLPGGLFPFVVKGFLCFSLFFTYPIMMFPVSAIIERMFFTSPDTQTSYLLGCLMRGLLVLVSGLVVICIPNFSTLMALVGSGCCTMLGFILPAVFHWIIYRDDLGLCGKVFHAFLISLGVIGSIIGTLDAISRLYGDKTTAQVQISMPTSVTTPLNTSS